MYEFEMQPANGCQCCGAFEGEGVDVLHDELEYVSAEGWLCEDCRRSDEEENNNLTKETAMEMSLEEKSARMINMTRVYDEIGVKGNGLNPINWLLNTEEGLNCVNEFCRDYSDVEPGVEEREDGMIWAIPEIAGRYSQSIDFLRSDAL